MAEGDQLPTLGDKISEWLGFQLPAIPMPQSVKNFDKAVGRLLLSSSENASERIKANTAKVKVKGRIAVDGLYRTEEEKRRIENRAAAVATAVEEINSAPSKEDAKATIDDDWLNLFARLSEDKSSEELQSLFGRILAGEIRTPGSFSLRTIQLVSTLSTQDANAISTYLSFALHKQFVPRMVDSFKEGPSLDLRLHMEELGMIDSANTIGGLEMSFIVQPNKHALMTAALHNLFVVNRTERPLTFAIRAEVLTTPARELAKIARPPATNLEFLKQVAQNTFDTISKADGGAYAEDLSARKIDIQVVRLGTVTDGAVSLIPVYTATKPPKDP